MKFLILWLPILEARTRHLEIQPGLDFPELLPSLDRLGNYFQDFKNQITEMSHRAIYRPISDVKLDDEVDLSKLCRNHINLAGDKVSSSKSFTLNSKATRLEQQIKWSNVTKFEASVVTTDTHLDEIHEVEFIFSGICHSKLVNSKSMKKVLPKKLKDDLIFAAHLNLITNVTGNCDMQFLIDVNFLRKLLHCSA